MSTTPVNQIPPDPPARKPSRRGRWLLLILGFILVCGAAGWFGYARLTDPQRLRTFAAEYLQGFFNGTISVGGAEFAGLDQVKLFDVRLSAVDEPRAVDGQERAAPPAVFACRQVELVLRLRSLLRGKVEVESVSAIEPEWTIRRDVDSGRSNLHGLVRAERLKGSGGGIPLPRLELRDSRLRVLRAEEGVERLVENLQLSLRGSTCEKDARWYDVAWSRGDASGVSGHSQIDLADFRLRNVRGGLPWLSIEAVAIAVDSHFHHAAVWSDLLGLEGAVRASDYDFDANDAAGGRTAVLELEDATLAIPLPGAKERMPADERFLRFENVYGRIRLQADSVRAEFDGRLRNSECHAVLTMRAADGHVTSIDDVDLEARLVIRKMELPRVSEGAPEGERNFVNHWPDIKRFYERFDPHGPVDLELELGRKAGPDAPLELRYWMVRALGGDASFINFPYRLYGARGVVVGTPGGTWIDRLTGRRDGAEVEVNGWYSDHSHCAQTDIRITARHVPIDDVLCQALSPRFRTILQRFQPEGEIDLDISLVRPLCAEIEPMEWNQTVVISLPGIRARYGGFPYPVEDLRGPVIVRDKGMFIPLLEGRVGEGELRVSGRSVFSYDEGSDTTLELEAINVPIDSGLIAALPSRVRNQVEAFHPEGTVDARIDVHQQRESAAEIRAEIDWNNGRMKHEALPVPLEHVSASMLLEGDALRFESFHAVHGSGLVSARGIIEDLSSGTPLIELQANLKRFNLNDELYGLAPQAWTEALAGWRVFGEVNGQIDAKFAPGTEIAPQWSVETSLADAVVRHPRVPLPITNVRGDVLFHAQGWETPLMEASYGDGQLRFGINTHKDETADEGSIYLDATGLTLDPSMHVLFPAGTRPTLERIAPYGRVDVSLRQLDYTRGEDGRRLWSFSGSATLQDVGVHSSVGLDKANGVIEAAGTLVDRSGGVTVNGTLQLSDVELWQRELESVSCDWSLARAADGRGRLALDGIDGRMYDGSVSGDAEFYFGQGSTEYRSSVTAFSVDVDRFINSTWSALSGREPARIGGTLDARLRLAGAFGDESSRSGGGRVEVANARIYRQPLIMAILNVINLAPTEQDVFADVSTDLLIMGNRVDLKNIELSGPMVSLLGSGYMSWPDMGLDIRLVNVHNERWSRVPGLTGFLERASRELVELHVTGSAEKPSVRTRPIPALTDELRELFQKKKPTRIESAPS